MSYPLKSNFKKGDLVTDIGAEWFNTVAKILNGLSIQGGTINKTVDGENWTIIPQIAGGVTVTVLDDVYDSDGIIRFSRKKLVVLAAEDEDDAAWDFEEKAFDFLKVTSLDDDGCPDASEWRTIKFLITSDVASTIDD